MKIAVFGLGYVGLSNALLLAKRNSVVAVDVDPNRVDLINCGKSPIRDTEIENALASGSLDLIATTDADTALKGADYALIATPTNYDSETNYFDTSSVDGLIALVAARSSDTVVVVKSTIPIGYTEAAQKAYPGTPLLFSPEFLREGKALYDNLHPSRIVVGGPRDQAERVATLLLEGAEENAPVLITGKTEAESIKLFANSYLAMRVAFINELDSFASSNSLSTRQIIRGIGLDPRIGMQYNNPSFGYGGYCLPKDTKQLLANYSDIPQTLIRAIVESNTVRIRFVVEEIMKRTTGCVGVFRLAMKLESDNFRESAVINVIDGLLAQGVQVVIYEPELRDPGAVGPEVIQDLAEFKRRSDLIISNRYAPELGDVLHKVYSRDIFGEN